MNVMYKKFYSVGDIYENKYSECSEFVEGYKDQQNEIADYINRVDSCYSSALQNHINNNIGTAYASSAVIFFLGISFNQHVISLIVDHLLPFLKDDEFSATKEALTECHGLAAEGAGYLEV